MVLDKNGYSRILRTDHKGALFLSQERSLWEDSGTFQEAFLSSWKKPGALLILLHRLPVTLQFVQWIQRVKHVEAFLP